MYITEQCEFDNYTLDVIERIKGAGGGGTLGSDHGK